MIIDRCAWWWQKPNIKRRKLINERLLYQKLYQIERAKDCVVCKERRQYGHDYGGLLRTRGWSNQPCSCNFHYRPERKGS